jgi:hypothetical protein
MIVSKLISILKEILPVEWDASNQSKIWFEEGPDVPDQPANYTVTITAEDGLGLMLDGVLDNLAYQIRVTGKQNLTPTGQELANAIDLALLNLVPGRHEDVLIVSIYRVGGRPSHFEIDDAERRHFVCSYYFDVESGLQPI